MIPPGLLRRLTPDGLNRGDRHRSIVLMLEQHHVKHGGHQMEHRVRLGMPGTRLPSVLNALSQPALYDVEADGGTLYQQDGLRQRVLA